MIETNEIFVFGSNLAGRHGKGAALHAKETYGAEYGVGRGFSGNSYGIPTKDETLKVMPLELIERYVKHFLKIAAKRQDLVFKITALGTGLAGYKHSEIAPMFKGATSNCQFFEKEWLEFLAPDKEFISNSQQTLEGCTLEGCEYD